LMNGERAILFATDPPYLVDYDGTNHPQNSARKAKVAKGDKSGTDGVNPGAIIPHSSGHIV